MTATTLDATLGVLIKLFSGTHCILFNNINIIHTSPVFVRIIQQHRDSINNLDNEIIGSDELNILIENIMMETKGRSC